MLHAILDRVVDDYIPAIEGLENDIDEVEAELFSGERTNPAQRVYRLQREVLQFRRAAVPLVDPIDRLAAGQYDQVHPEIRDYFRDVNDHLMRTRDQLDAMRDILQSGLHANLAEVSVRQNDDMRKISAWIAIVAVPTDDCRDLRHELRAHAGTVLDLRLPAGSVRDGRGLRVPVLALQALRLAVTGTASGRRPASPTQ